MRSLKRLTAFAAASVFGVLSNVSPAQADAGAGVSTGHSTIETHAGFPPDEPLCAFTQPNPKIFLTNVGTIELVSNGGTEDQALAATYVGDSGAEFLIDEFYFNPIGTYRDDGSPACMPTLIVEPLPNPAPPELIPVERWTLNSSQGAVNLQDVGAAECGGNEGTYTRVTNAYVIQVSGTCTVTDGVTGLKVTEAVSFVFSGNQNPCLGDPPFNIPNCDPPLQETEFEGVYAMRSA